MKNRLLKLRLPYFYRRRLHTRVSFGTILERVKPESEREKIECVTEDILRWADDGGQMLDLDKPVYPSRLGMTGKQANEG